MPGRPRLNINKDVLEELRGCFGFTWYKISKMLNVSRWTVARRVEEFDLYAGAHFSDISDEEVDSIVKETLTDTVKQPVNVLFPATSKLGA